MHHLVGQLHGQFRLALVILDDQLHIAVPGHFQGQLEPVAHVGSKIGAAPAQRGDHADLDLAAMAVRHRRRSQGRHRCGGHE